MAAKKRKRRGAKRRPPIEDVSSPTTSDDEGKIDKRVRQAAKKFDLTMNEQRVCDLHLRGWSHERIRKRLGWKHRSTACQTLQRAYSRVVLPSAKRALKQDLDLLLEIQRNMVPLIKKRVGKVVTKKGEIVEIELEGDARAAEALLKLVATRQRLFGNDKKKVEHTGKDGGPIQSQEVKGGVVFAAVPLEEEVYEPADTPAPPATKDDEGSSGE